MSIEWLTSQLPLIEPIERRSEADYYGASHLIASELGLSAAPPSVASWKHGLLYETIDAPELLLTEGNRATRHLVTNNWQADRLRRAGFLRVHAVGVPFLHVVLPGVRRLPRSLLIMPAHNIRNSASSFDETAYAEQVVAIRSRFDLVVACVSSECVRTGSWINTFDRAGIPWIIGADSNDRNALRRMRALFGTFEFVSTNFLGSNVAYAAYSGCKVSIWGPYAHYELKDFANIPWYRKRWSRVAELIEKTSESHVRSRHPVLFRDPWDAVFLGSWAEPFLGVANKREPAEMARLLGWTAIGRTEVALHRATRGFGRFSAGAMRRLRRFAAA